ncbi:EAL domain-containing protein [Vibrio aestuarianus]|uniref:putative bifunctional diguanylate cyclase/phosphodiesterase n=1 Tax=Vibrio aestuarianus TaxID=28171 RepID=UPI00237D25E3|nr:bifunctional diguanylate cyclase/phosphodiesterase [Vibrio aestuarianus]MDE1251956.1 EAL domain-containing protein [Vibrio aestuarianus]
MTKTSLARDAVSLDTINELLALDNNELFDRATLVLHTHFQSFCTCIIELDKLHHKAHTLSYACENRLINDTCYQLKNTPCEQVGKSKQEYCLYPSQVAKIFPDDNFLRENHIESYIGIPLRAKNGEVLGILVSTFCSPVNDEHPIVKYHSIIASMVVHSLRNKWLSERSDSLVNQLSHEVSHDNLTNLMNRSYLSDKLERLIETVNEPFTLAYLDIDNFKSINDLYGHYIGDQVIKFVANTILEHIPEKNLAFRIAGDEFAFITFSKDPLTICRNIISSIESGYVDTSHRIKMSLSIGIAKKLQENISSDQLILNASLALKDCKQVRGEHIKCYDSVLSVQYHRRTQIIDALRYELDKAPGCDSEIFVVTQPIVRRAHDEWDYFEVLARWNSETLGSISPLEFIEAAEQSGLIVDLGKKIVELACIAKLELEKGLGYKVKLGLNCSAYELSNSNRYIDHLMKTIAQFGFEPNEFTIELTETVLLSQTSEVLDILDKLRFVGFTIALDDFGTGYSSLNYIHSYPIDCIKIDATFIRNMLCNETSERVVWLIVQLANQLQVDLIAEGVESQEALEKLYAMGCDQIQGYYFSRPETPHSIVSHWDNIKQARRA